jgi:small subunit ribosomal protein S7
MRRRQAEERELTPDVKYNSELLASLINVVMRRGKKSTAQKIVYGAMEIIREKQKTDPLEVFLQALENAKPMVEVKSRRVGGANYQVPVEISPDRQLAIALRWMVNFARGRKGRPMRDALAAEILDAYNNTGASVKKRDDTHRMAQANKAFAHYRW